MRVKKKDWQTFEQLASKIYRCLEPGAIVTHDDKIYGNQSERMRQIDVSIRHQIAGHEILVIVQVRDKRRAPDVNAVGELAEVMKDVGASKGVIVCRSTPTVANLKYARKFGIDFCSIFDVGDRMWNKDLNLLPVIFKIYCGECRIISQITLETDDEIACNILDVEVSEDGEKWQSFGSLLTTWFLGKLNDKCDVSVEKPKFQLKSLRGNVLNVSQVVCTARFTSERMCKYVSPNVYQALQNHSNNQLHVTALSFELGIQSRNGVSYFPTEDGWTTLAENEVPQVSVGMPIAQVDVVKKWNVGKLKMFHGKSANS